MHAPCFKAMLLEGGVCHAPYARLKAVTVAIGSGSGQHLYEDSGVHHATEDGNTVEGQRPPVAEPLRHQPIDNQLIADMCW